MPGHGQLENPVCVFVFPTSLTFYVDDPNTHKQILSINNPYGFPLKFKILSTDNNKYTVSESQGFIKPLNAQDIVVKHRAISPKNIGVSDVIRVQLFSAGHSPPIGIKEIAVTLLATKPDAMPVGFSSLTETTERFQQLKTEPTLTGYLEKSHIHAQQSGESMTRTVFFITLFVICGFALYLPNEGDTSEHLPSYLQVSSRMKLIAAFVLGCLVTVFLRT